MAWDDRRPRVWGFSSVTEGTALIGSECTGEPEHGPIAVGGSHPMWESGCGV
jgi:hypothetical protein